MKKVFTHILIPKKSVGLLPQLGGMCLLLFISFLVHAQEQAVSCTVKDESRQLLPGTLVKCTSNDFTTDADGTHLRTLS